MKINKQLFSAPVQRGLLLGLVCLLTVATTTRPAQAQRYKSTNQGLMSHLTFEGGGGITAPIGNSQKYIDLGWNFMLGAGYRANRRFSILAEWEFNGLNIPSDLALSLTQSQTPDGNDHLWMFQIDPKFDYARGSRLDAYVLGGGGFSRQLTTFTSSVTLACPVQTGPPASGSSGGGSGSCVDSLIVANESSNQGTMNIGTGGEWRTAPNGRGKIFLEARYVKVFSPTTTEPPGYHASIIPITFGVRW